MTYRPAQIFNAAPPAAYDFDAQTGVQVAGSAHYEIDGRGLLLLQLPLLILLKLLHFFETLHVVAIHVIG